MPRLSMTENFWSQAYTKSIKNPHGKFCLFYAYVAIMNDRKMDADEAASATGLPVAAVNEWLEKFLDDEVISEGDLRYPL
jgi:hypothetical protein